MNQRRRGQPIPRNQGRQPALQFPNRAQPRVHQGPPVRNRLPQTTGNNPGEISLGTILLLILLSPVILVVLFFVLGILVAAGAALGG
jgi:hypothetical protein